MGTLRIEDVRSWLLRAKPGLKEAELAAETDLIESRILDSVTFVNFVYFIEEATGKKYPLSSATAELFRTLASVHKNVLGEASAPPPQQQDLPRFHYSVDAGMATLGPDLVRIRSLLDSRFSDWAAACGAVPMLFPPLMRVEDLSAFDYFKNFPHLAAAVTRIDRDKLDAEYATKEAVDTIPPHHLVSSAYVLPSAACYNVYLFLRGRRLSEPLAITTISSCFRNEEEYQGLRRLWGFTMREIVRVGPMEQVQEHLRSFKVLIKAFLEELGLPYGTQLASDPFFQPAGAKARMQALFPTKEEFVYGGSLAFASLNFHRNFFGERCGILTADGKPAYSGCVAFGVERWLHALLDHFKDPGLVMKALTARAAEHPSGNGKIATVAAAEE